MVVPEGHEHYGCNYSVDLFIAAEGDIEVSDEPLVEPAMPHPPEPLKIVVVEDAAAHVVDDFDAEELGECAMDPPND